MKKTHGESKTRLYVIWGGMVRRCKNCNCKEYKNYGERGIEICNEWMDFLSFKEWSIKNGYMDLLEIDRIDNDGNYEPSNCRWVTKRINSINTRVIKKTNSSGYKGVDYHKKTKKWRARIRISKDKRISLGYFHSAKDAGIAYDNYIINNRLEHSTNCSRIFG